MVNHSELFFSFFSYFTRRKVGRIVVHLFFRRIKIHFRRYFGYESVEIQPKHKPSALYFAHDLEEKGHMGVKVLSNRCKLFRGNVYRRL